jgi:hypothetical protein
VDDFELVAGGDLVGGASSPEDHTPEARARRRAEADHERRLEAYYRARRTGRWYDPSTGMSVDFGPGDGPPTLDEDRSDMTPRQRWMADAGRGLPWCQGTTCTFPGCHTVVTIYAPEAEWHRQAQTVRCHRHLQPDQLDAPGRTTTRHHDRHPGDRATAGP